jgi:hypothetical protein
MERPKRRARHAAVTNATITKPTASAAQARATIAQRSLRPTREGITLTPSPERGPTAVHRRRADVDVTHIGQVVWKAKPTAAGPSPAAADRPARVWRMPGTIDPQPNGERTDSDVPVPKASVASGMYYMPYRAARRSPKKHITWRLVPIDVPYTINFAWDSRPDTLDPSAKAATCVNTWGRGGLHGDQE